MVRMGGGVMSGEAGHLLCSRSPHDQNVLAGRVQLDVAGFPRKKGASVKQDLWTSPLNHFGSRPKKT
jgi:hypothetical protein